MLVIKSIQLKYNTHEAFRSKQGLGRVCNAVYIKGVHAVGE